MCFGLGGWLLEEKKALNMELVIGKVVFIALPFCLWKVLSEFFAGQRHINVQLLIMTRQSFGYLGCLQTSLIIIIITSIFLERLSM